MPAAERSICSRKTRPAGVPATAPARRTGRRSSAPRSLGQRRGVRASLLGLTKRTDGKRQVTYAGHPLYTFSLDRRAGETSGQGLTDFGGSWNVVAASGRAVKSTASSGSSGGNDGGYGGYSPSR